MQRFCLFITLSGLLLLFAAVTLLVVRPDLLHARAAGDAFMDHRAGQ